VGMVRMSARPAPRRSLPATYRYNGSPDAGRRTRPCRCRKARIAYGSSNRRPQEHP
jgi:hypothetical protein